MVLTLLLSERSSYSEKAASDCIHQRQNTKRRRIRWVDQTEKGEAMPEELLCGTGRT